VAVAKAPHEPVTEFDDWYVSRSEDARTGCIEFRGLSLQATSLWSLFEHYKREHEGRVQNYWKYETMADAEVVSRKPDLPNVSSGEIAGMVRRVARNVVQNTPNVDVVCEFDDKEPKGILARYILKSKIIGDDLNSNEMQQSLFSSVMSAFTLGFEAVTPVLVQKPDKSWAMNYDVIHYRDFFPEPGVKDARKAPVVFVRRYLTKGEVHQLIRHQQPGWDIAALKKLCSNNPPSRQRESVSHQDAKHHTIPDGYEIVTWYSMTGDPFLTFDANTKMLLRIEKNKDPLKRHPVQVLVLEKDSQQPLGKSQISLVYGRQEFQDLMLNGAMKLWYKNINPTLLGYGTGLNGIPNMSPGKYVPIPNPNAKIEPFEVNTQTLLQYGAISQQNLGSMVNLVGAADQQMAASSGNGMSATPQGVEAQEKMVDITTNNYQKAVEYFFSLYCSYALTLYFAEMSGVKKITPTADARRALIAAGMPTESFDADGVLDVDMSEMATVYHVRCVPGSLVEMEDEKQLRILQEIFVPLSQAMPALAQTGDQNMLANAAQTMQFILAKTIELSGSAHADQLKTRFLEGNTSQVQAQDEKVNRLEAGINSLVEPMVANNEAMAAAVLQLQEQMKTMTESQGMLLEKLGVMDSAPAPVQSVPVRPVSPVAAA
jgi:hypothetical protein